MSNRALIATLATAVFAAAGVPVYVTGKTSTNTDANGNFSIAGVAPPYDITVVDATNKRALVYKGLSRQDPTLTFLGSTPGTARHGTINGKVSGGTFAPNQGASDVTRVEFASAEASAGINMCTVTVPSGYTLSQMSSHSLRQIQVPRQFTTGPESRRVRCPRRRSRRPTRSSASRVQEHLQLPCEVYRCRHYRR